MRCPHLPRHLLREIVLMVVFAVSLLFIYFYDL